MNINGWKYYNHAALPTCAPHETPDLTPINNKSIWRIGERKGGVLFARWTSDWDCSYETNWWYVIKDKPFDISILKSKRRYEINKGNKRYDVKVINPIDYLDEIYEVTIEAISGWPEKYRPTVDEKGLKDSICGGGVLVFAAFSIEKKTIDGYATVEEHENHANFTTLRVKPKSEKTGINAAIVNSILTYYRFRLGKDFYICDGERSIRHETAFQDYLEKYFEFRKAYCKLHLRYKKVIELAVKILFPFRTLLKGRTRIGNQIIAVLKMEEIAR